MPAAAVIPAPIVYTKVVAVKKLVVGLVGWLHRFLGVRLGGQNRVFLLNFLGASNGFNLRKGRVLGPVGFTLNKLGCLKQAYSLEYISMG